MISKLYYFNYLFLFAFAIPQCDAGSFKDADFTKKYSSADCFEESALIKELSAADLNLMLSAFMDPCNLAFANISLTYKENFGEQKFNECGTPSIVEFSADVPNLSDIKASISIPPSFNFIGNVIGGSILTSDPLVIEPVIQNPGPNGSISFSFELQAKCNAPDDEMLNFMFDFIDGASSPGSCQEMSLPLVVNDISLFIANPGTPGRNTEESIIAVLNEEHDITLTLVQEGVGHIENVFFYVDDHPQLTVDSIIICGTGHVLPFVKNVGTRSYYLMDTMALGGDGFQRNEGIDVCVQWHATSCSAPGDPVDDIIHGVVSSCALDPEIDICESDEYSAIVDFGEKTPEIRHMMDTSVDFDPLCFSDGPTEQAWFFINTGEAPAGDIVIRIDDHGGAPMMDLGTLEIQIGSDGTPFTPAIGDFSALNKNGIPACALAAPNDFYSDFTYEMLNTNLVVGDTIFVYYTIEAPNCTCGGVSCSPPKRFGVEVQDLDVYDLCDNRVQNSPISNNGSLDRWPGFDVDISSFMESPITICDGDSETLTTNISNYTNAYLSNEGFNNGAERNAVYDECTDCYLEVEYIIPHGLDWAGSVAADVLWFDNDGTTYNPDYVDYTDNDGGSDVLILRWIGQEISNFDPFNEYSTILLDYAIDCDNELMRPSGCGYAVTEVSITKNIRYSTGSCTNCTDGEDIECEETIPVVAKCFGTGVGCTPCEGFVQTYAYGQRSNLREADQDNDGVPNGTYDDLIVRRDRFLKGDSIEVLMGGYVQHGSGTFDYIYGILEMPNDEFLPIGGEVTVKTNGGPTYTCDVLTQSILDDTLLVTDLSISRLSANGCSVPLNYNDGDSVFVTYYFKPTRDFSGEVDLLRYKTRIFASNDPYGGAESSCRLPIEFRMTQVGLQSDNVYTHNGNIGGCSRKVVRYEGYSRVGGPNIDYFPGEYLREIDVVSTLSATIPEGMIFDFFRVIMRRKNASSATSQGSNISGVPSSADISAPHPALTIVGDEVYFDLEEYVTSEYGDYPISDGGYSYSLEFRFIPSCKLENGAIDPIELETNHVTDKELFCSVAYTNLDTVGTNFNGGAEISIEVIGTDSILVDRVPTCTLVRVRNTGSFNADNTWLTFGSETGYIVFSSLSEIDGSDTISVSGGLYNVFEIGDLGSGQSKDFEICVFANICGPEKLIVYAGYDCETYPIVLEEATCFDTTSVNIIPVEPALSMISKRPTGDIFFDDVCDTATYIVDINASGPGFLDDIELEIELPIGIDFIPGSFEIAYPTSVDAVTVPPESEFESIGDPNNLYGNTYILNISESNSILQNEGLIGSAGSAFNLNVVNVRFDVVTSCGFTTGSRIFYESSARQGCGGLLLPRQKDFSPKLGLLGTPPPFVSDIEIQADTLEACVGESSTVSITYAINGMMTTNDQDSLRVILPPGISYVSGSYRQGTNILPDPPSVINEYGLEVLYWGVTGLDPGSTSTFSLDIMANDIGQACKDYAFMVETFKSSEAFCDVTGQTCTVRALSDQARENIFIIKPNLIVESASISSMAVGNEEMIMLDVALKNDSEVEMASGSGIVLDIYGDLNNDGRFDKGIDTLLTSIDYDVSLTPGESAIFSSTANIPAEFSCTLLAVIDVTKNCSCESTTSARITSDLNLKFPKDIEVCSNSDIFIGPDYNSSYGYSWVGLGGADLSALSRTDSTPVVFNYSNNLSTPITFNYGLIVSRSVGCYILDTVQVTIYPDNSGSLVTNVCGPVPSCGATSGFSLSGPVTGTGYDWSIVSGDLSATVDDESDPTSQVSSGISMTTQFQLEYTDATGCPATFLQTVSTISCACTSLGDTVWYDLDVDGMQDVEEPGIPNMTIYLYDANDLGTPIQSTTTDANGYYEFQPLPQGNYVVGFDTLGNTAPYHLLIPTQQNIGNDEDDSDADILTGYSDPVFISNGVSDYTIDAGFYPAFDLALKKEIDLASSPGPYFPGDTINYIITIYNQGGYYGASDITIEDYFTSDLSFDAVETGIIHSHLGTNVTISDLSGGSFQLDTLPPNDTVEISISFIIDNAFNGNVIDNYAEISAYSNEYGLSDIDSYADSDSHNDAGGNPNTLSDNSIDGDGSGSLMGIDPGGDEDDHDPARITLEQVDLALIKRIDPSFNTPPIVVDEYVKFDIILINQGEVALDSIEVVDRVPSGYEFDYSLPLNSSQGWKADSTNLLHSELLPGQRDTVSIYLKALFSLDNEDYVNNAEITAAYDTRTGRDVAPYDIDSSPNSNTAPENATATGSPGDNNITSTGLNDVGSEDDHDIASVDVVYVDVAITKKVAPSMDLSQLKYGDSIKYLITVMNQGGLDADTLIVKDYLPPGLSFDDAIPDNNIWSEVNDSILISVVKDLPSNSARTMCLWLRFNPGSDTEDWTNLVEISKFVDDKGIDRSDEDIDSELNDDINDNGGGLPDSNADDAIDGDGTGAPGDSLSTTDQDNADPAKISFFDLALVKQLVTPGPYSYGDTLSYEISVVNQGNIPATNIVVSDSLSSGLGYITGQPGWSGSHPVVTNTISDTLQMGDTVKLNLDLILNQTTGGNSNYTNISEITASEDKEGNDKTDEDIDDDDGDDDDNENETDDSFTDGDDDRDAEVLEIFDLALRKELVTLPPYDYGDTLEFIITTFNQGNSTVRNIELVDYLPCGLRYDSLLNLGNNWSLSPHNLLRTEINSLLQPRDSIASSVSLIVTECDSIDSYLNTAEIESFDDSTGVDATLKDIDSDGDAIQTNDGDISDDSISNEDGDEDDHDIELVEIYDVALNKGLDIGSVQPDGFPFPIVQYNIEVFNQGNVPIKNIVIADYLPCGLEYNTTLSDPLGWALYNDTVFVTISDTILPDSSIIVSIHVNVQMDADLIANCVPMVDQPYRNFAEVYSFDNTAGEDRSDYDVDSEPGSHSSEEQSVLPNSPGDNEIDSDGSDGNQDDHDPADLMILDLALTKGLDQEYHDAPFKYGDTLKAFIEIINQGNVCVDTVRVVDYLPDGMEFIADLNLDWDYNKSDRMAHGVIASEMCFGDKDSIGIFFRLLDGENRASYTNWAEITSVIDTSGTIQLRDEDSRFDSIQTNDTGGIPESFDDDLTNGDGLNNGEDEDDHDPLLVQVLDLALKKSYVDEMKSVTYGSDVKFDMTIYNQGNLTVGGIELHDYLPEGLRLSVFDTSGWAALNDSTLVLNWNGILQGDDSLKLCLHATILPGARFDELINYSEISEIRDTNGVNISDSEADSQPDNDRMNDIGAELDTPTDDQINDDGTVDEDDHDVARAAYVDLALFKTTDQTIPVTNGDDVTFTIHVINQGLIAAEKIAVVDYVPSGFVLSPADTNGWITVVPNSYVDTVFGPFNFEDTLTTQIVLRVTDPVQWQDLINEAEINFVIDEFGNDLTNFDRDSRPDNDNTNDQGGEVFGPTDNETQDDGSYDEDDHDPAVPPLMDIALKKTMVEFGDPVLWNDTLEFVFHIFNQGNVKVQNTTLVDYIGEGYTFSSTNAPLWDFNAPNTANVTIQDTILPGDSVLVSLFLVINEGAQLEDLINYGEISYFEDENGDEAVDYDSTPDDDNSNDGDIEDDSTDNTNNDEDDHDVVTPPVFDLALRKTPVGATVVNIGDQVEYLIEIFNQGSIDASGIEVADYNHTGLSFIPSANPDWKITGDHVEFLPTLSIPSGESDSIYITLEVVNGANSFNLINEAEIIGARDGQGISMNAFDIDSTPDDDFDNDVGGLPGSGSDDEVDDIGLLDEDDHDPAILITCVNPIACIGNVNVSISDDCNLEITPGMILVDTSNYTRDQYDIDYFDLDGNPIETIRVNERMNVMISVPACKDRIICWTTVLVEDKLPPIIDCAPNDTMTCLEMLDYPGPTTYGQCGNVEVNLVFEDFEQLCENDSIIGKSTRSYQAVDPSGNASEICTQVIYIKSLDINNTTFPSDTTISCNDVNIEDLSSIENLLFGVPGIDTIEYNETLEIDCNFTSSYEDFVIIDQPCKKKIMRMWEVNKWTCGGGFEEMSMAQIIDIVDTLPPVISFVDTLKVPASQGDCRTTVYLPGLEVSDNCSDEIKIDLSSLEGLVRYSEGEQLVLSVDTHTVYIQAIDACHNVSRDSVVIIVADASPPLVLCLSETVVAINDNESVSVGPDHFDLGSLDACSGVNLTVGRMNANCDPDDITLDDSVSFCCSDIGSDVMVVLQAEDMNGNTAQCMVSVNVQDEGLPSLVCPPDITVGCNLIIGNLDMFGSVRLEGQQESIPISPSAVISSSSALIDGVAFGNCLDSISAVSSESINNCGVGTILRTFTAVDMSGNANSCTQRITISNEGLVSKTSITFPSDTVLYGCIDTSQLTPSLLGVPMSIEGKCNLIGYAQNDLYVNFNQTQDSGCWKVMRTWSVFEMCSGKNELIGTEIQEIKVVNQIDPMFIECTTDTFIVSTVGSCSQGRIELSKSAIDDCTTATSMTWRVELDSDFDGIAESVITPSVEREGDTSVATIYATLPFGFHRLVWISEDQCGNQSACEEILEVQSISNLSAICLTDISADLMPVDDGSGQNGQPNSTIAGDGIADGGVVTLNANSYDIGSSYFSCNQSVEITYSFSNTMVIADMSFNCSDIGTSSIPIYVLAIDKVSNAILESSLCNVNIIITDSNNACDAIVNNPATLIIEGNTISSKGENIENVEVRLTDLNTGSMNMDITNIFGQYAFKNPITGDTYNINPFKDDDWINGVSTLDLILIQNHILGKAVLSSPYDLVASDINKDGHISAIDLVFLRKLILGIEASVSDNTSWRFIWADQEMDEDFTLGERLIEEYEIRPLEADMSIDWIGVKVGDISGNAIANEIQRSEGRGRSDIELTYDLKFNEGHTLISFYLTQVPIFAGLQGEIELPDGWRVLEMIGGQLKLRSEFVHVNKNKITLSINQIESISLNPDLPIFSILVNGQRSEDDIIEMNTKRISPEIYADDQVVRYNLESRESYKDDDFVLYQNTPNPWMESTEVSFDLPKKGTVEFNLFDSRGVLVLSRTGEYPEGLCSITLTKNDLTTTGYFIYEISFDKKRRSGKMIHIK